MKLKKKYYTEEEVELMTNPLTRNILINMVSDLISPEDWEHHEKEIKEQILIQMLYEVD